MQAAGLLGEDHPEATFLHMLLRADVRNAVGHAASWELAAYAFTEIVLTSFPGAFSSVRRKDSGRVHIEQYEEACVIAL